MVHQSSTAVSDARRPAVPARLWVLDVARATPRSVAVGALAICLDDAALAALGAGDQVPLAGIVQASRQSM